MVISHAIAFSIIHLNIVSNSTVGAQHLGDNLRTLNEIYSIQMLRPDANLLFQYSKT
ncbi:MAG: hypothetical protein F6K31_39710 [Symploca sp. SIO2G7]|nr:hypothetical protein [Symploca sp. SIO2G7]